MTPLNLAPKASRSAALAEVLARLDHSQWQSTASIEAQQLDMLRRLLAYHKRHSPWVQQRLEQSGSSAETLVESLSSWAYFPPMSRRDLQLIDLDRIPVPATHEPVTKGKSSGSTGEPVTVRRTAISTLLWQAHTLRDHLWHQRDPAGTLFAVRALLPQAMAAKDWGVPVASFFETGPAYAIPSRTDLRQAIEWLKRIQPNYLLIYPSIWRALLDATHGSHGIWDSLRQVRTIGETVSEELRARTHTETPAKLVDLYSAEEVGTIALQCPQSGLYHTMAENLIVEVIDSHGRLCRPGEVGQVVITDLSNLATPLLRYANGDYAEQGPECPCGRGLPTLKRIIGRERNMVQLPDGRRHWPVTGREFGYLPEVRQYQLIQHSLEEVEVRLVVEGGQLDQPREHAFGRVVTRWLGHPFKYRYTYFKERIPHHPSGKFEEFICLT